MAFAQVNDYDVEHVSNMLAYENLFPAIQHINGKGATDKWTTPKDIESVTYIDIMRVLPYAPEFRQLGADNNGGFANSLNKEGYSNAPQSVHYTIPVNLLYDRGIPLTANQDYANPIALRQIVADGLVQTVAMVINVVTFAKQIEGYFRNGDNFDKALTHNKGSVVAGDITDAEVANAVFAYDPAVAGLNANSPTLAFQKANARLNNGVKEIGAFVVPVSQRQAFITGEYGVLLKGQYAQNASESAVKILSTGYMNPFTGAEMTIDERTGLLGMYDGVGLFQFYDNIRDFVYVALGVAGSTETAVAVRAILDKISGFIVYGGGTCRGFAGPNIEVNKHPFQQGFYMVPRLKMGINVLHGGSIKMIVNAGASANSGWSKANIATVINSIAFTPIDGVTVTAGGNGFNDGTTH